MVEGPIIVNPRLDAVFILLILMSGLVSYNFGDPAYLGYGAILYMFLPYIRDCRLQFESEEEMDEAMKCLG